MSHLTQPCVQAAQAELVAAVLAARLQPEGRAVMCCPVRETLIWTAFCSCLAAAGLQHKVSQLL